MSEYPVENINKRILDIEDKYDILNQTVRDVYFYERIRYSIYKFIHAKTKTTSKSADPEVIGKKTSSEDWRQKLTEYTIALSRLAKGTINNNPYLHSDTEYLLFGTSKRFKTSSGYWADKVLDPVMEELPGEFILLERSDHECPLQINDVAYLDVPWYLGHVPAELGAPHVRLTQTEKQVLHEFESAIESEFNIEIEITDRVRQHLARRQIRLPLFRLLVSRVDPNLVIMRGAFGEMKSTFIEACHRQDVKVVDCQFRQLNQNEAHYHYPGQRQKRVKADYFLTWGEFWSKQVALPFEDEDVFNVGYPYIEDQYGRHSSIPKDIDVLFVSSLSPGHDLSKFAAKFVEQIDDLRVVYKLHPNRYDTWKSVYPWLENSPIEVIDDHSTSLFELFAKSRAQVGVTSTALYEGLRFSLPTYLISGIGGLSEMRGLIDQGYVTVVSSPEELADAFLSPNGYEPPEGFDVTELFEQNPREKIYRIFKEEL